MDQSDWDSKDYQNQESENLYHEIFNLIDGPPDNNPYQSAYVPEKSKRFFYYLKTLGPGISQKVKQMSLEQRRAFLEHVKGLENRFQDNLHGMM